MSGNQVTSLTSLCLDQLEVLLAEAVRDVKSSKPKKGADRTGYIRELHLLTGLGRTLAVAKGAALRFEKGFALWLTERQRRDGNPSAMGEGMNDADISGWFDPQQLERKRAELFRALGGEVEARSAGGVVDGAGRGRDRAVSLGDGGAGAPDGGSGAAASA